MSGTIIVDVDGKKHTFTVDGPDTVTPDEMNAAFQQAGIGGAVHCMTAEEVRAARLAYEAKNTPAAVRARHVALIRDASEEDLADVLTSLPRKWRRAAVRHPPLASFMSSLPDREIQTVVNSLRETWEARSDW